MKEDSQKDGQITSKMTLQMYDLISEQQRTQQRSKKTETSSDKLIVDQWLTEMKKKKQI